MSMSNTEKSDAENSLSAYKNVLSQIKGAFDPILLNSIEYTCPADSLNALPNDGFANEPVEYLEVSWQYSFEKTKVGFRAHVNIANFIECRSDAEDISLEIGFTVFYISEIELSSFFAEKFAYEKLLPDVWPYFRELALDLYHKSGLLWVILPLKPNLNKKQKTKLIV
jgi:hypothetical protein